MPTRTKTGIFDNEASAVDLKVYDALKNLKWTAGDTLLYQHIILTEEQLQRIYEFPAGSVWDFFLAVLGVKKIQTTRERIEVGFESYLQLYNFTTEQADTLRKIKDAFVANLSSQGRVDIDAIFANPIYARLIGSFEQINQRFDGKLKEIVGDMQNAFKVAA